MRKEFVMSTKDLKLALPELIAAGLYRTAFFLLTNTARRK
jgi:hypothetical protein